MSKLKYCAVGDYGVEFAADSREECQKWIRDQEQHEDIDLGYYAIKVYTQAELDAMPED